jgi:hypothetical protein
MMLLHHFTAPQPSFTPVRARLLLRKCACGGAPKLEGECEECRKKRVSLQSGAATVPPIVREALRSSGQPLDLATRTLLESRFGHDFSRVRVYTDAKAAESARAVNALAYTVGRDIVFGSGQYRPSTPWGQRLLAHEATHVLQQRDINSGSALSSSLQMDSAEDASEKEAEAVANRFASAEGLVVSGIGQREGHISRQLDEEESQRREPARNLPGDPLPYREAMEQTERGSYEEYRRDCAGITTLERLERQAVSPLERVRGLERRLRVIPYLFEMRREINQDTDPARRQARLRQFQAERVEGDFPQFPRGYALSSEEDELARAQCELSKARWEFIRFMRQGRVPGSLLRR